MSPLNAVKLGREMMSGDTGTPAGCGTTMNQATPPANAATRSTAIARTGPCISAFMRFRWDAIQKPPTHTVHAASRTPKV